LRQRTGRRRQAADDYRFTTANPSCGGQQPLLPQRAASDLAGGARHFTHARFAKNGSAQRLTHIIYSLMRRSRTRIRVIRNAIGQIHCILRRFSRQRDDPPNTPNDAKDSKDGNQKSDFSFPFGVLLCVWRTNLPLRRSRAAKSVVLRFFRELRSPVSGETIRGRKPQVDIRGSCCRFRCWSGRESAWLVSKVISAMGGTPGPAPKSMQLSRSSLLSSYLQRFNAKRRIHYKIDVQPRWRSDTPSPRLKEPVKIPSRDAR